MGDGPRQGYRTLGGCVPKLFRRCRGSSGPAVSKMSPRHGWARYFQPLEARFKLISSCFIERHHLVGSKMATPVAKQLETAWRPVLRAVSCKVRAYETGNDIRQMVATSEGGRAYKLLVRQAHILHFL